MLSETLLVIFFFGIICHSSAIPSQLSFESFAEFTRALSSMKANVQAMSTQLKPSKELPTQEPPKKSFLTVVQICLILVAGSFSGFSIFCTFKCCRNQCQCKARWFCFKFSRYNKRHARVPHHEALDLSVVDSPMPRQIIQ